MRPQKSAAFSPTHRKANDAHLAVAEIAQRQEGRLEAVGGDHTAEGGRRRIEVRPRAVPHALCFKQSYASWWSLLEAIIFKNYIQSHA